MFEFRARRSGRPAPAASRRRHARARGRPASRDHRRCGTCGSYLAARRRSGMRRPLYDSRATGSRIGLNAASGELAAADPAELRGLALVWSSPHAAGGEIAARREVRARTESALVRGVLGGRAAIRRAVTRKTPLYSSTAANPLFCLGCLARAFTSSPLRIAAAGRSGGGCR